MFETSDFRNGLKIEYQGEPYVVVDFQHVKPGKGNQFTRTEIKNLISGRVLDPTFKSGEKIGKPDIEEKEMQYLYRDGEHYACMDNTTYEQVIVDKDAVGDMAKWLIENATVSVLFWNGRAITLEVAKQVVFLNCFKINFFSSCGVYIFTPIIIKFSCSSPSSSA